MSSCRVFILGERKGVNLGRQNKLIKKKEVKWNDSIAFEILHKGAWCAGEYGKEFKEDFWGDDPWELKN